MKTKKKYSKPEVKKHPPLTNITFCSYFCGTGGAPAPAIG